MSHVGFLMLSDLGVWMKHYNSEKKRGLIECEWLVVQENTHSFKSVSPKNQIYSMLSYPIKLISGFMMFNALISQSPPASVIIHL